MKKCVLLDGQVAERGGLDRVRGPLTEELTEVGFKLDTFELQYLDIAPCQGCFGCWVRNPGECLIDDESKTIVRAIVQAELLVLFTAVTFGGYSSELKKALDRGICLVSPFFMKIQGETHHEPRYKRMPRLLGVGVMKARDVQCEQIFASLVRRNSINLHSPACAAVVIDGNGSEEEIRSNLAEAVAEVEGIE